MNHEFLRKVLIRKKVKLNNLIKVDHDIFKKAIFIRNVQEKIIQEYRNENLMKCPIHLCIGQELPAAIIGSYFKKNISNIFCHHRSHAYFLSQANFNLDKLFSEIMGRHNGANSGFAGSQDISDSDYNFYAGAIITGSVGIAVGDALYNKLNDIKKITLCVFGEGAAQQGLFWEAINFSVIKKLPIIFLCENNFYATYSKFKSNFSTNNLAEIVEGYKCLSKVTSTFDFFDLKKSIELAFNSVKKKGPFFLEILTYRLVAHVGPEDDLNKKYRSKKEIDFWKKNDLINIYKEFYKHNYDNYQKIHTKEINNSFLKSKKQKFYSIMQWEKENFSNTYHELNKKIIISKIKKTKFKEENFFIPQPY